LRVAASRRDDLLARLAAVMSLLGRVRAEPAAGPDRPGP